MSITTILFVVLLVCLLLVLALLLWRALERREQAPEPRHGYLAVDLRDRNPGDDP